MGRLGLSFLFLFGCAETNDDSPGPTHRLYQAGCESDRDCQDDGVCRNEGVTTICYPLCTATACTTPEGAPGTCEERACVPSCAQAACPGDLSCIADRCVPVGTPPPPPRYDGTWAGMIVAETDESGCGGSAMMTETSTVTLYFVQTENSVAAGIPGEPRFQASGAVQGDSAMLHVVPNPTEDGQPDCPPGGSSFDLSCTVGEDPRAQPLGIGMFCFGPGTSCGCPGGSPLGVQIFLAKQLSG